MIIEPKEEKGFDLIESVAGFRGKIYFGVPQESSAVRMKWNRNRTIKSKDEHPQIDNAMILAIMEHGSPVKNIPERKLLEPVVNKHAEIFEKVYLLLLDGDEKSADLELEILAQRMERWTKAFFNEDNGWEPNAPSTIRRKKSDHPLIDTGSLRQSIRGIYVKK